MKNHTRTIQGLILSVIFTVLCSCSTTRNLDTVNTGTVENDGIKSIEEEGKKNEAELHNYYVQEELKVQDIENTVIFIDRPVYIPEQKDVPELERKNETGYDAALASQQKATVKPENYKNGTFFYQYNENLVYEVYAQPYHLTDIILERGETVNGNPLFSEDESVWELTAGVSKDPNTGEDIQHFFIKPAYSKLDSTLIIITNRRVYHFRVKSFSDTHMAMVKFTYPERRNVYARAKDTAENGRSVESDFIKISNPEFLSFDYKIKYSMFKTPEFLPKRVYDDGQSTYIQVDDIVLHKKLPVLFNEKNEIENYSVKKNVFVVPRLINKLTLRLGKEKVTIEKKKSNAKTADSEEGVSGGR
jgi:Type IV secretory pathway, VirB9 components